MTRFARLLLEWALSHLAWDLMHILLAQRY